MRIWIDVLTPKQVLFFKPLVDELIHRGHRVLATSRDYREVKPLAEGIGFNLKYYGRHGGGALEEKLSAYADRILAVTSAVKDFSPDLSLSFSSPECARVSFGLGVSHIAVNDSPHSESVAKLTLPLSELLLTPWIIPKSAWARFGIPSVKILRYRALDPAAWLKRPSPWRGEKFHLDQGKKTVTVRVEESFASYLRKADLSQTSKILDLVAANLKGENLVLLCRYKSQVKELSRRLEPPYTIPRTVIDGRTLLESSDLFIGFGGTMTSEAALLGVPTISAYPGTKTIVENYLVKKGLVTRASSSERLIAKAKKLLEDEVLRADLRSRGKELLVGMEDPILRIADTVEACG